MTILYKPVLIESAEQAEALPIGTVALETGDQGQATGASIRVRGGWHYTGYCLDFEGAEVLKHSDMVGDYAFVPIEAEEEWEDDGRPVWSLGEGEVTPTDVDDYERRNGRRPSRRLVTPWEEA